jgi:tol-pal system protein YbgF
MSLTEFRNMRYTVAVLLLSWAVGASAQPASNNEMVVNLYNQLQELQNEILTLRGMVEEQGYQLQRLQNESRDRYLDLDRRLQSGSAPAGEEAALGAPGPNAPGATVPLNAPASPDTAAAPSSPAPLNAPSQIAGVESPPAVPPASGGVPLSELDGGPQALELDEQETYRTALNLLLEQNKPGDAIALFQSYITRFSTGRLFTNALYWQGEAFILVQRNQEAVDVFNRLISEHPQDAKAPGAMLKAGVAYNQMGDRRAAEGMWRDLQQRFPTATAEINAAQDYLRR